MASLNVNIQVIEHSEQRYETAGDWFFSPSGDLNIRVSRLKDSGNGEYMEQLVALHEYIEALLCKCRGISGEIVTDFDTLNLNCKEPGNLPEAPYYHEHQFATFVEYKMAEQLKINWEKYDEVIAAL